MNIVSLSFEDFAGVSYNLCQAINLYSDHRATSIRVQDNYIGYPKMVQKGDYSDESIIKLINDSDVIHINDVSVNGLYDEIWPFWLNVDFKDKILIKHHHGILYETNKAGWDEDDKQMHAVTVSTPDLLGCCDHAVWFPSPIPVGIYRKNYPAKLLEQDNLTVSFSDTVLSEEKGKSLIAGVVDEINRTSDAKIELLNISHQPNWLSLMLLAKADINFNQVHPRFATMSALEAACFEKPIIGNPHPAAIEILDKFKITNPYAAISDRDSLVEVLKRLVNDEEYRLEMGSHAYRYVKRVHDLEVSAKRFVDIINVCLKGGSINDLKETVTY